MAALTPGPRRLVADERWTVVHEDGVLVLHGGADALYALQDVAASTAEELASAWGRRSFALDELSASARDLIPQLVEAGVFRFDLGGAAARSFALEWVGNERDELAAAIAAAGPAAGVAIAPREVADHVVYVRTNGRLADLRTGSYVEVDTPHLLLDVAYRHTISLGPLVFPGDTACLGCLAGRIGHYWGDAPPPSKPGVQRHAQLIASLLVLELEKIAGGDHGLVNATVSWDLARHELKRHAVYKLPWCPACGRREPERLGSISLPWAAGG